MGKSLESQFRSQKHRVNVEKGLFLLGLFIRLFFVFWMFEGPLTQLFVPFLQEFLAKPDQNPWTLLTPEHFPYGSFLFGVLIAPAFILKWLSLDHAFSLAVSVKLILLIFDFFLYRTLRRLPVDRLRWCLFYWCNPLVIYVSFVHGQLDIVSMSLLMASILSMTEKNVIGSGLFLLAAVSSKFHVILAFPVLVVFLWNQEFPRSFFRKLALFASLLFPASLLLSYPVLVANHIRYITIGSPEAQRLFALKSEFLSTGHSVYWGVILITFVLGRILISTHFSRLALIFAVGLLLNALLFVTDPSPGWILWGLPFICLLHSIYTRTPPLLILALCVAYFAHEIVGLRLALSLQQTLILSYGILFEILILHRQAPFLNRRKPLLIGISGDSGAGKDTLTQQLSDVLGSRSLQIIAGDNYHRWERGHANWKRYTHLHPSGNSLRHLHHNLMDLREGRHIWSQFYDHDSGRFTPFLRLTPARNVIVQGLHTLFHPDIRRQFDLRIHLAPHESLRKEWKLQRDTQERGHSAEKVQLSLREREKDSASFIQTQAPYAHWIISFKPGPPGEPPLLRCDVPNEPLMMDLAEALGMQLNWNSDLNRLQIEQKENESWSQKQIEKLAQDFFGSLRSVTRGRQEPRLKAGTEGALQLIFLAFLERERQVSSLYFDPSPRDPID